MGSGRHGKPSAMTGENYFITYIVKKKKCLAYADDKNNKLLDFIIFVIVTPVTMYSPALETVSIKPSCCYTVAN